MKRLGYIYTDSVVSAPHSARALMALELGGQYAGGEIIAIDRVKCLVTIRKRKARK
jgi:hypothetical protein